jgi:hypothetical protein
LCPLWVCAIALWFLAALAMMTIGLFILPLAVVLLASATLLTVASYESREGHEFQTALRKTHYCLKRINVLTVKDDAPCIMTKHSLVGVGEDLSGALAAS